jgi:hypothetical protein
MPAAHVDARANPRMEEISDRVRVLMLGLEYFWKSKPYCLNLNDELAAFLGWDVRKVQRALEEAQQAGLIHREIIPSRTDPVRGSRGATARFGIVARSRFSDQPAATSDEDLRRAVAEMHRELDRRNPPAVRFPAPPAARQECRRLHVSPDVGCTSDLTSALVLEEQEGALRTTTTEAGPGSEAPADIHAIEGSSSSPVSIPLRPEGRAIPDPAAPGVAVPVEAVDPAGIAAMEARAGALFVLDETQARCKVARAISDGRRIATAARNRFEPGWVGAAMDEAERQKAAGKLKGWHWGVVMGIVGNYAREGGPSAREDLRRSGAARRYDPAVCLARARGFDWTLSPHGPDQVVWAKIPGGAAPAWKDLPSDLRQEVADHKAELKAHVLERSGEGR